MFNRCDSLTELDLSKFVTKPYNPVNETGTNTDHMLYECETLYSIKVGSGWDILLNFGETEYCPYLPGEQWYIEGTPVTREQIPREYGPGTYVREMPLAVYNEDTESLTFYCDHESHPGTEVFAINPATTISPVPVLPE
ncbi:MAG: hypothetical protein Q4F54_05040 [Coriobacteriia bacterium]|nr:hypothetical protein [Coriobacteriia bacterium]